MRVLRGGPWLEINGAYSAAIPNEIVEHFNWPNYYETPFFNWAGSKQLGHYYAFNYFLAGQFGWGKPFEVKLRNLPIERL